MGFFEDIALTYGWQVTKGLKNWANINNKLASQRNRRIFLLSCRKKGITPKHITNNTKKTTLHIEFTEGRSGQLVDNLHRRLDVKLLNIEIKIVHETISRLEQVLNQNISFSRNNLPLHIFNEFNNRQLIEYNRLFHKIKATNLGKIDNLLLEQKHQISTNKKWFKNLTTVQFPEEVVTLLSLGPKFCLPPRVSDLSIKNYIADIEFAIQHIKDKKTKNIYTSKITNALTNYLHINYNHSTYLNFCFDQARKFLRDNPEILILKSDKGNVTTAMFKNDYITLSNNLLNDEKYYKIIDHDPTSTIQQKANKLISHLKHTEQIDLITARNHSIYNATISKYYALPKTHKEELAVRPIISSISAPNSKIAKLLTDILTDAYDKNNKYYVPDSFSFARKYNDFQLPPEHIILSLDVKSLFTNIPLQLVEKSIDKHWGKITRKCDIQKDQFLKLIRFIFDTTTFSFNNIYYKQIFGSPMGSKLSPIISQYVMDDLINECLSKLNFNLPFLIKYVDDIICSCPRGSVADLLQVFNSYNPNLQFTIEHEDNNNSVPFLDTRVIRTHENRIILDWYQKPTSSGRYMNFHSHHPIKMKINLVNGMKKRICNISHPSLRDKNLRILYNLFKNNSYPTKLLHKLIFSTPYVLTEDVPNVINTPNVDDERGPVIFKYFSIPYIKEVTPKISKILKNEKSIKLAHKSIKTVNQLFSKIKDKVEDDMKSNVVYKIQCNDCEGVYIGQTSRNLKHRITSHRSDIRLGKDSCSLATHCLENQHSPNYNDTKVLTTERNTFKRNFLEMVFINNHDNTINRKTDIQNLNNIYCNLLDMEQKIITKRDVNSLSINSI